MGRQPGLYLTVLAVGLVLLAAVLVLPGVWNSMSFPNRSATNVGGLSDAECEDLLRRTGTEEPGATANTEQMQYCLRAVGGRGVPAGES